VLIVAVLAGEWLNNRTNHAGALTRLELRWLAIAGLATLAATLVNPNGVHQVLYPLVWVFPTAYSNVLTEWVSTNFHEPVFVVFEAMLLLLIAAAYLSRRPLNWTHLALVAAFTHLALAEGRNVAVWSIVVSPLLAFYLQGVIDAYAQKRAATGRTLKPSTERVLNITILVLALAPFADRRGIAP